MAVVYGDETSYPGMIYPWLGTLRLLNGLAHPDALRHAGFGGGARRSAIKPRTCANRARDTATSASWNVTYRPCRTTLAPILTSFSRRVDRDYFTSAVGTRRKSPNARICDRCRRRSRHRRPAADPTLVYEYTTQPKDGRPCGMALPPAARTATGGRRRVLSLRRSGALPEGPRARCPASAWSSRSGRRRRR